MIEFFSIILHLFVITIFCYAPSSLCLFISNKNKIDLINHLEIGLVFNLFFLLLLSFILRSGSNLIYYLITIVFIINFIALLKDLFLNIKFRKLEYNFILLVFVLLFVIFSIDLSNNLKLGWDAQNYWLAKKLVFSNGGDIFDLQNTQRVDYPYLGSFIWHIYSKFSFLKYEYFGRIFYIYIYLIAIFSISSVIKVNNFEKLMLIFLITFFTYKVSLFNGYQEILNFSLLVLATKIFYEIFNEKLQINKFDRKFLYLFILINSIIWIKSESTILIMIFLFSIFLLKSIKSNTKILIFTIFSILLIIKYFIFELIGLSHEIQKGNYEYFQISNFFDYVNFSRALLIIKYIFYYSIDNIIFIISGVILSIMYIYDKKNKIVFLFLYMFIFGVCFFILAFLLNSFPLEWVLWTALDRVIFETTGMYIILIPLFYEFLKKRKIF